jgi:hypothetical protein
MDDDEDPAVAGFLEQRGVETLQTADETGLGSMLALNRRFGYRPLYEEIVLRGPLGI